MSPYGMDKEKFAEKMNFQTKLIENMRDQTDKFSPVSEKHYPFMNYIYPESTPVNEEWFGEDDMPPPLVHPKRVLTKFREEWVPKGLTIVQQPVFKFFVPGPPVVLKPDRELELPPINMRIKSRVGICSLRKLPAGKTVDFQRPLRQDDPYFERMVRIALECVLQDAQGAQAFLCYLLETRIAVMGYVANETSMSAHYALYRDPEAEEP